MAVKFFLPARGNIFHREIVEAIVYECHRAEVDASLVFDVCRVGKGDVVVLLEPHETVAIEGEMALWRLAQVATLISLGASQPGTSWFEWILRNAHYFAAHFDLSNWGVLEMKRAGHDCELFSFGYTSLWDCSEKDCSGTNELDFVFLGASTPRRAQLLAQAERLISSPRSRVILSSNSSPSTASTPGFLAGAARRDLLSRSQLQLALHRSDNPYFDWFRFIDSAHTGSVFVCEPSLWPTPFVAGVDFIQIGSGGLTQAIDSLLSDADLMAAIRTSARARIMQHPLKASVDRLVKAINSLESTRISSGTSRRTPSLPIDGQSRRGLEVVDHTVAASAPDYENALEDLAVLKRDVSRLSDAILEELKVPKEHQGVAAPVFEVEVFNSEQLNQARCSVVIPCRDGEKDIETALESAACVDQVQVEIVVVNDASRDQSRQRVIKWAKMTPWVRVVLIDAQRNLGLPLARNVGIAHSSCEYVLMLDHDNELFPGSLSLLVEALDQSPEAAFSFGTLVKTTRNAAFDLVSHLPWNTQLLRQGNYIDALALVRKSSLSAIDGPYRTDGLLFGWEDYDLWLRLADRDMFGVHVPIAVGRYLVRPNSMIASVVGKRHMQYAKADYPRVLQ